MQEQRQHQRQQRVFEAVFTRQKRQKRKRWTDGILAVSAERRKLRLFAAPQDGAAVEEALRGRVLDELFVQDVDEVDEDIEFENHLVERGAEIHLGRSAAPPRLAASKSEPKPMQRARRGPSDLFSGSLARPRGRLGVASARADAATSGKNAPPSSLLSSSDLMELKNAPPPSNLLSSSDLMELMGFDESSHDAENRPPANSATSDSISVGESQLCPAVQESARAAPPPRLSTAFKRPAVTNADAVPRSRTATRGPASQATSSSQRATSNTQYPTSDSGRAGPAAVAFKRPRRKEPAPSQPSLASDSKPAPAAGRGKDQRKPTAPTANVTTMLPAQSLQLAIRFQPRGPWDLSRRVCHALPSPTAGRAYLEDFQRRSLDMICEEVQASLDGFADYLARGGARRVQSRYDASCTLFRTAPRQQSGKSRAAGKRRRHGSKNTKRHGKDHDQDDQDEDDSASDDCGADDEVKQPRIFLNSARLKQDRAARKACRFGDLWLVSRTPFARDDADTSPGGAKAAGADLVWVFQAVWHGPSAEGVLEVVPVSLKFDPRQVSANWHHKTRVYALHGPNLEHEVAMARLVGDLSPSTLPLLPSVSLPSSREDAQGLFPRNGGVDAIASAALTATIEQFRLNEDQQAVLRRAKAWITAEQTDPVILVHGAYGAGKTQLSVATIMYLAQVLDAAEDKSVRICVAAATNVAVDNVLKGLKRRGFTGFNRVGSIRNMDQELLEHALHYSERGLAAAVQDARAQLTDLSRESLRAAGGPAGPAQALRYLEQTPLPKLAREQERREAQCRVVGVTCCSSSRDFLMQTFQKPGVRTICLLDEAAQAVEALSMLPLVRTRAQFAMLVGDPLQLPPLTATTAPAAASRASQGVANSQAAAPEYADGATPMFERLCRLGRKPVQLSVQYRCHPRISGISSKLFYGGAVRSGVSASDRAALIPGLPPVGFYDVGPVQEQRTRDGSFVNEQEQVLVCRMIAKLIEAGIRPDQIGAIALYRAQAEAIEARLQAGGRANGVAVSTVDAFQGAERDVILISTCRTTGPGFTACPRRVNVMLTRAKHHLVILGRRDALSVSQLWRDVLMECDTQTSLEGILERLAEAAQRAQEAAFDEDLELERELHGV